jgi:WXXGXW repeat (2 copies)
MKKNVLKAALLFMLASMLDHSLQAQFVVKVRPAAPVVVRARPLAPSPRHVWVDGDWVWRNNQYVYTEGRWVLPAYSRARWIPGHWKLNRRRGGWYWMPGHWSRR